MGMKFQVKGIAFIPVEVGMLVEAETPEQAMRVAEKEFAKSDRKQSFILNGSEDEGAVFDFRANEAELN